VGLLVLFVVNIFNESLGYIMQKILVYGMGAHNFTDCPFPFGGFVNVDRSLHDTLNIGEIEPVFPVTTGTKQTFSLSLKLLVAIYKGEGFNWHSGVFALNSSNRVPDRKEKQFLRNGVKSD
jgi:hypothetical protein